MDTKIIYSVDTHVRTLVFPNVSAEERLDDGQGILVPLAIWGERYFTRYGAKSVRMIETLEGDFATKKRTDVPISVGPAMRVPGGAA